MKHCRLAYILAYFSPAWRAMMMHLSTALASSSLPAFSKRAR